jgi:hypothetical protein
MLSLIGWIRSAWPLLIVGLFAVAMLLFGHNQWNGGYRQAKAEGDKALADLRLEHADQRTRAAEENLLVYRQQVTRANQAETRLLETQGQLAETQQQLAERIAHVSNEYRPAPAAAPVPVPRCVFTRGWVRDFNLALGAGLPAAGAGATAASPAAAAWPAPGTDAELLESGVTPADILAYAQDYGRWAQSNLAQLNALLDTTEQEPLR